MARAIRRALRRSDRIRRRGVIYDGRRKRPGQGGGAEEEARRGARLGLINPEGVWCSKEAEIMEGLDLAASRRQVQQAQDRLRQPPLRPACFRPETVPEKDGGGGVAEERLWQPHWLKSSG